MKSFFQSIVPVAALLAAALPLAAQSTPTGLITIGPWDGVPILYSGDNDGVTNSFPDQIAMDTAGNVYFAVSVQDQVLKLNVSTETVTVVAGTANTSGDSGDGGDATAALLNSPTGVAVDSAGNVYIADLANSEIRVVNTSGVISRLAQSGSTCNLPVSLALDTNGNLYVSSESNLVCKINLSTGVSSVIAGTGTAGYTGDGGAATSAELNDPYGLAIDANDDLFIADSSNNVVRELNSSTGNITTVAGNGTSGYSGDGGPATDAELSFPIEVSLDAAGNLYIADASNNAIRMVTASTGNIDTVSGENLPAGVIPDSYGNLYLSNELGLLTEAALYQPINLETPWGNTTTQSLTFTNIGQATVAISGASISGTAFSLASSGSCTAGTQLAPQQSCSASIVFSPTAVGSYTGDFVLSYSGANTTQASVALSGDGELDTPTISSCPTASNIPYGERVYQSVLSGGIASVPGTFSWDVNPRAPAPSLGTYQEPVTFTPNDTTDYNTTYCTTELTVGQATPTISAWPTASGINYGQELSASTLADGTAFTAGTFAWTTPSITPPGGTGYYSVTFTPTDTTDYTAVTGTVTVAVAKQPVTITGSSTLNPSVYGDQVTFTFTFAGGGVVPTGQATILDTTTDTTLGTATLNAAGVATFTSSALAVGTHTIEAAYGGDSNYY